MFNQSSVSKLLIDILDKIKYSGVHRGKVTEVDIDDNNYGTIRVFIPTLMTDKDPDINESDLDNVGIRALPGNNPLGGRNNQDPDQESFYQGSVYIPPKGSWVYVFFEGMNPNKARYLSALDLENTMLPPENRLKPDGNPLGSAHKVYTLIKTNSGRTVLTADDSDVQRVEITGKKRNLSGPPEGNLSSAYTIDGNQTTILLDERSGKEKLLVRTYKGDYIHLDIDERNLQVFLNNDVIVKNNNEYHWQTSGDVHIKTSSNLYLEAAQDIHMKAGENFRIESGSELSHKAGSNMKSEATGNIDIKAGSVMNQESGGNLSIRSSTIVAIDGIRTMIQSGASSTASPSVNATPPSPSDPEGSRDT